MSAGPFEEVNTVGPRQGDVEVLRNGRRWRCHQSDAGVLQLHVPAGRQRPSGPAGRRGSSPKPKVRNIPEVQETRPASVVDPEVYGAILEIAGEEGRRAACEYYGRWYISADAVLESRAAVVLDTAAMEKDLVARFGMERLHACGLVVKTQKSGKDYFLLNRDYPVVEPHITPAGKVVGMQFRPSNEQLKKVEAHKAWTAAKERGDTSVPEAKYVPKFMSLSGVDADQSLIGFGLHRLWQAPPGTIFRVVEGFKDYLAARTMGHEAFGIPGTSSTLSEPVLQLLRKHRIAVALDGDAAGVEAQNKWVAQLREKGVKARPMPMPEGMDVADILVARHTRANA